MISIKNYEKPSSIEEAYTLLKANKKATLIGGGAFLKLGSKSITTGIDLSEANLDYIKETDDYIEIGAMTTFHELETNSIIKNYAQGLLGNSVKDIVGIQMRNMVTVGATIYSRYGFSDFVTALLALEVEVKLYNQGIVSLDSFLDNGCAETDILESIIIKKREENASFSSIRKTKSDYAVLNVAVSKSGESIRIAVGARPNRGILAKEAALHLEKNGVSEKTIEEAGEILAEELVFGSNMRGTAEYRKSIAPVLFKRNMMEVMGYEG